MHFRQRSAVAPWRRAAPDWTALRRQASDVAAHMSSGSGATRAAASKAGVRSSNCRSDMAAGVLAWREGWRRLPLECLHQDPKKHWDEAWQHEAVSLVRDEPADST